jgi:murein DD-endopeptidase MepM/ murein hydrolase activator NlpD
MSQKSNSNLGAGLVLLAGIVGLGFVVAAGSNDPAGATVSFLNLFWPLPQHSQIDDPFGTPRTSHRGAKYTHTGVDTVAPTGTWIYSAESGKVIKVGWQPHSCGQYVIIEHKKDNIRFRTTYCHMVRGSATVRAGQKIGKGMAIGKVGNTGRSTKPHLHFGIQIREGGRWKWENPAPHFRGVRLKQASMEALEPVPSVQLASYGEPDMLYQAVNGYNEAVEPGYYENDPYGADSPYQYADYDPAYEDYGDTQWSEPDLGFAGDLMDENQPDWTGSDYALAQLPAKRPQIVYVQGRDGVWRLYWSY